MGRYITPKMENGLIVYHFDQHTKNHVRHIVTHFVDFLEVGDYMSYPLDIPCIHRFVKYIAEIPEDVARLWLERAGLEPKNKLLQVVYVRGQKTASGIYQHDFKYYIYSLISN